MEKLNCILKQVQTCNLPWQLEWKLKYNNKKKLFNYSTTQYIIQHGNEPIWLYMLQNCNTNAMQFSTLQYKNWHSKFDKFWQDHIAMLTMLTRCEVKR